MKTINRSILLVFAALVAGSPALSAASSPNEKMTTLAWEAFLADKYQQAVALAERCIKEFRRTADDMQKELKEHGAPSPVVGSVPEPERTAIFNRGPLNDVASCYFIKGEAYARLAESARAAEQKEMLAQARLAYEAAARYTYARTWDPQGWFWSPAKKANERLEDMAPAR